MSEVFRKKIAELVEKSHGNQAEAARKMGRSKNYVSVVLRGQGPKDPHTSTWNDLYRALGQDLEHMAVREVGPAWNMDLPAKLAAWLRRQSPAVADLIYATARLHGFEKEGTST